MFMLDSNLKLQLENGTLSESSEQPCVMKYEFSGGNHEVPCFNDTYFWIVC